MPSPGLLRASVQLIEAAREKDAAVRDMLNGADSVASVDETTPIKQQEWTVAAAERYALSLHKLESALRAFDKQRAKEADEDGK